MDDKKYIVDKQTMAAVKQIVDNSRKDVPQMGYFRFKREYLHLLASPPERDEDGNVIPRDLSAWMDIAMHPSNAVQILNDDGTLRFTVPPMVGTIPTYFAAPRGGLVGIVTTSIEKSNQHPVYGQKYLKNMLDVSLTNQPHINNAATREWNNVLVEHGYPPLPGHSETVVEIATTAVDVPDTTAPAVPKPPVRVISDNDYDDL